MATPEVKQAPFPAPSKSTSGVANNLLTSVSRIAFSDKIIITISQISRLSHWIHVSLASSSADPMNPSYLTTDSSENSLLPRSDLTATTIMGGTKREDEVVDQTLATTIASAILVKRPSEQRMLVLGIGLQDASGIGRQGFEEIVGLVLDCL